MFHLPIHSTHAQNSLLYTEQRESRGYVYNILKYQLQITETILGNKIKEPKPENYTVLTDKDNSKIFAYMAPRQTSIFYLDNDHDTPTISENGALKNTLEWKESIEGTMITFFWNEDTNEWNICTRNGVGCDYSYVRPIREPTTNDENDRPKTFRQMVFDALNGECDLQDISKSHCYACILKHSENHIVYNDRLDERPALYLIAIYELNAIPPLVSIESEEFINGCVRELPNPSYKQEYLMESKLKEDESVWEAAFRVFKKCPEQTAQYLRSVKDLQDFKNNLFEKYTDSFSNVKFISSTDLEFGSGSAYFPPAWIMTNITTGHRCEITNPFYEMAKNLRNFQPNTRFQYLDLRRKGMVETYLQTFPQYTATFKCLEIEYDNFVTEVYNAYVKFYIMNIRDGSIPKNVFVNAARIHHRIYLAQTEIPRRKITQHDVERYFVEMEPSKMFYYLTH